MSDPELVATDWSLFRADGNWHDIGHGIEVMAYMYMTAGTFYIRAKEPLPRGSEAGEHLAAAAASYIDQQTEPAQGVSGQANHAQDDQLS